MFFVDNIIPILSFIVSFVSVIIACIAIMESRAARKISEEANRISEKANEIATKEWAPSIKLSELGLEPTEVKVYGGVNVPWQEKEELDDEFYDILQKTRRALTTAVFGQKEYLLINLCDEDTPKEDIGLVLDAFYFVTECKGKFVVEFTIMKLYSLLYSKTPFDINMSLKVKMNVDDSTVKVPIAYACPYNLQASLNLGNIVNMAQVKKDTINLRKCPQLAGKLIGFAEAAYLIKCLTTTNDEFLYTMYIKKDESGRLDVSQVYMGQERYNMYYDKAKKRANREIQLVSDRIV